MALATGGTAVGAINTRSSPSSWAFRRAAAVGEELLDLMKSAGFNEVDIGAESACDEVLESLAKDFKRSDVLNIAYLLKKKKIPATWFIMLGAPAETRESVFETLKTMVRVASKWDMVFVSTGIR